MPGLYGIVSTSRTGASASTLRPVLQQMTDRFHCRRGEFVEREYVPEHGRFAVGRIDYPANDNGGWPAAGADNSGANLSITAGSILSDGPICGSLRDPGELAAALRAAKGFYSLFYFDAASSSAYVATDVRASVPVYYASAGDFFYFAPEIRILAGLEGVDRTLDFSAIANLLASGFVLGNQTLINGIRRLEGGRFMACERPEPKRYFSFRPGSKTLQPRELREEFAARVCHAVELNLQSPEKSVVFLSGGIDSRGILGAYRAACPGEGSRLNTVTWGTENTTRGTDPHIAGQIARLVDTSHLFIRQSAADYAEHLRFYNRCAEGLCEMPVEHARQVRVMQQIYDYGHRTCIRGDEVFGWSFPVRNHELALWAVGIRRFSDNPLFQNIVSSKHYDSMCSTSDAQIDRIIDAYSSYSSNQAKDIAYFEHRLQNYLQGAINFRRYFFDDRNVWLDEDILELMQYVPDRLRTDKRLATRILRSMDSELWRIPVANVSQPQLAEERASLEKFIGGQLADNSSGVWEYFDKDRICEIFRAQYRTNPADSSQNNLILTRRLKRMARKHIPLAARQYLVSLLPDAAVGPRKILGRLMVFKDWHDDCFGEL